MPDGKFGHKKKYYNKTWQESWQSHVTRIKALGGWRHDNSFLSLDTVQDGLDHERVLEKKFDLQLLSICASSWSIGQLDLLHRYDGRMI